jgi:hypothetical protein
MPARPYREKADISGVKEGVEHVAHQSPNGVNHLNRAFEESTRNHSPSERVQVSALNQKVMQVEKKFHELRDDANSLLKNVPETTDLAGVIKFNKEGKSIISDFESLMANMLKLEHTFSEFDKIVKMRPTAPTADHQEKTKALNTEFKYAPGGPEFKKAQQRAADSGMSAGRKKTKRRRGRRYTRRR